LYKIIVTYFLVLLSFHALCQETEKQLRKSELSGTDTTLIPPRMQDITRLQSNEPAAWLPDFLVVDTLATDSLSAREEPPVIEAPIDYTAEDSIVGSFDGQKVYMYNNARVVYQQIELQAYFIELDLETKEVYAEGIQDSTGNLVQKPIFKDGNEEFESKTLRYNFETEKGIVTMIENVPVFTFRGGSFKRDILNVTKDQKEALKFHMAVLEGKK